MAAVEKDMNPEQRRWMEARKRIINYQAARQKARYRLLIALAVLLPVLCSAVFLLILVGKQGV